jgi:hypothetical protein
MAINMSTKCTIAHATKETLHAHLYHEMHDECVHLVLSGPSYSAIDIVIPSWMIPGLAQMIEPDSTEFEQYRSKD